MNNLTSTGLVPLAATEAKERNGHHVPHATNGRAQSSPSSPLPAPDSELLRRCAWEIGERKAAEIYTPVASHVGLAMASPCQGFAHWRILPAWVDEQVRQRGAAWHHCQMILRVYDVSCIIFNGFNANQVQDHPIHSLCGHLFFKLPRPGTWQLAEAGFLLRSGEFIPAARSPAVHFAADAVSSHTTHAGLLVTDRFRIEEIGNLWEQERILLERRKPKLRDRLRIAAFAFESLASGHVGILPKFVSELAAGQCAQGHEVHVFVPATDQLADDQQVGSVHYHPLDVSQRGSAVDLALSFARAAEKRLQDCPPFDLLHLCEWMTGLAPWIGTRPTVLSLSSIETTRRNGYAPSPLSLEIQQNERELAHAVDCILTPDWLRDKAVVEFGIDGDRVHAFPMEARLANDWEGPLDCGQVKSGISVGPLDRLILYIGPLEYDAGVDLLIEALPVVLRRAGNLRLAFVGLGSMHGHLEHRARELGVGHAIRLIGHRESSPLARLLRASEAVILPSRRRIHLDEGVVDLARRAGRPVITTHSGAAHLVRHEEDGLVTYDNPGSMVWAFDRLLSDPNHAEMMGRKGRRCEPSNISWTEAARLFMELCATAFPELQTVEH
jgi:glycosyltransferase involved in cell wall biosynthesis